MLVLTRRLGEEIIIRFNDQEVRVTPEESWGDQVRLSFDAPEDLVILREELVTD